MPFLNANIKIVSGQATFDTGLTTTGTATVSLGNDASDNTIYLGSGGAVKTVTLGSTTTTSATTINAGSGNINIGGNIATAVARTWTVVDNNSSALSFDASGKTEILKIISTDSSEGVSMSGTLGVSGIATINNTTESTGTTDGSLVIAGGVGIAKKLYIGGNLYPNGNIYMVDTNGSRIYGSYDTPAADLRLNSTENVSKGRVLIDETTDSSSISTGCFVIAGGIGIAKKCYIAGITTVSNTTESSGTTNGSLVVSGGVGIAKRCYIGGSLYVGESLYVGAFIQLPIIERFYWRNTNSDANMIVVFVKFLREIYKVDEKRFRILLYCYSDQDSIKLINFWSRLTKISKKQFTKPYIRKDFRKDGRKMEHGMIHIRYGDKKLFLCIMEEIDLIKLKMRRW